GRHGEAGVSAKAAGATRVVDTPEPLPLAVELEDRGVMKHQHALMNLAPQPRLLGVRRLHGLEGHAVALEEAIQALQLPLRLHRLGEAEPRVVRQLAANSLQPPAAAHISKRRPTILVRDILQPHRPALIMPRRKTLPRRD